MTSPTPSTVRSSADLGARLTYIAGGIRTALGATISDDDGEHRPQADAAGPAPEAWRSPDAWLRPVGAAAHAVAERIHTLAAELDPHGEGRFRPPPRAEYATARGALFAPGGPLRPLDILSAELTRSCDLLGTAATQAAHSGVIQKEYLTRELRGLERTVRAQSAALHLAATALGELAAHQLRHARTPAEAEAAGIDEDAGDAADTAGRPVQSAHPARELARLAAPLLESLYDGARPFPPLPAALRELEPAVPAPGAVTAGESATPHHPLPVHLDLPARDRVIAALGDPEATGNLAGLDWDLRMAANAIAVRRAAQRERLAGRGGTIIIDRLHAMDRLRPDPVSGVPSRRRFVAFDPTCPGQMIELVGDPDTADGLALYVPGTGTNLEMSHVNTEVAEHFVAAGKGRIAMLVFLGGNFPQDMWIESGDPVFTLAMAPLLARFSLDVQAYLATIGRGAGAEGGAEADGTAPLPVTVIGHSFGGAVVGTAETLGLWADRVMYVASPSAGIDVYSASQWRNRAPAVRRYSITVPGDPIELMQIRNGLRYPGQSTADIMDGVQRLDSGFFDTGEVMYGTRGHGGVFDRSSDAFWQMAEVIVGGEVVPFVGRSIVARGTAAWREFDGRLVRTALSHIRAQLWRGDDIAGGDGARSDAEARDEPIVVAGPGQLVDRKLSRHNRHAAD